MYHLIKDDKLIIKLVIFVICLGLGLFFSKLYQPSAKIDKIYKNALTDYDNGKYSNAYYLFSKISYTSPLKPIAIYRQALCAKALGDKSTELKNYRKILQKYPRFKLAPEVRYLAGQLLVEENPELASKYFKQVVKSNLDDDYKIASEYYIAKIQASKIRYSNKISSRTKIAEIEKAYRNYLKKYPNGRLALQVAGNWKKFNPNIQSKDGILIARAYYLFGNYKEAEDILTKTSEADNWAIASVNAIALNKPDKAIELTKKGVQNYSKNTDIKDYKNAVDTYLNIFAPEEKFKYSSELFSLAKGQGKDYIWKIKCSTSPESEKYACYNGLYSNYPEGEYAQKALVEMLIQEIKQNNYKQAKESARTFLEKFPDSEYKPQVLFWAGKIEQKFNNKQSAVKYYQNVVNTYPDSYYAYRSYWILKNINTTVININLDTKPVVYPYRYPAKSDILYSLLKVADYDMLVKFTKDDFIKSWVEYERGNYATSLILARDAMSQIQNKPVKNDLRWRLVYPQNYYKQVKSYAFRYSNNDALMMSIIREESSFNSEAQSGVGAIGLMQLMPVTAHDIGEKNGIELNTSYLFNPELNIRLGNLYYSTIRNQLNGKDISAVAAYNGGIGSVSRWKNTLQYSDTDEFVEQIPYEETRNYVKKVFRSYWNYTRIYQNR